MKVITTTLVSLLVLLVSAAAYAENCWGPPIEVMSQTPAPDASGYVKVRVGVPVTLRITAHDTDCIDTGCSSFIEDNVLFHWGMPGENPDDNGPDEGDCRTIAFYRPGIFQVQCDVTDEGHIATPGIPHEFYDDLATVNATWYFEVERDDSCPEWVDSCACDRPGNGSPWGASAGDPVNLATGTETYSPGPDITAYNPSGMPAAYQRMFYTGPGGAEVGYGSAGLPPGWIDNYDYADVGSHDGTDNLSLVSPRGTVETLIPLRDPSGDPTGEFYHSPGTPYLVSGIPSPYIPGQWEEIVVTWTNGQKWVFGTGIDIYSWVHRLQRITDIRSGDPLDTTLDNGIEIVRPYGDKISSVNAVRNGDLGTALLSFQYDATSGLLTEVDMPFDRRVVYTYDAAGQLYQVSQLGFMADDLGTPAPQRWTYGYTTVGSTTLLHTITVPIPNGGNNSQASINYYPESSSDAGKVANIVDGNGFQRVYTYQGGFTAIQVKDAQGGLVREWTQNFDLDMRNIGVSEGGYTEELSYVADPYRPETIKDRKGHTTTYSYDLYGHITQTMDPRGTITAYTYAPADAVDGRLVTIQVVGKHAVNLTYHEPSGLLQSVTTVSPANPANDVTTTYTYDDITGLTAPTLGNIVKVVAPGNNAATTVTTTLDYGTWPNYGQPQSVTDPLNHLTSYTYSGGQVATVTVPQGYVTNYDYNAADQIEKITYPAPVANGARAYRKFTYMYTVGTHTYGPLVTLDDYAEGGTTPLRSETYNIGPEGEVKTRYGDIEPVAVEYNAMYQPLNVIDGRGSVTNYSYDQFGNLTSIKYPRAVDPAVYDTVTYPAYDPNGNPTLRVDGNGVYTTFAYNDPDDHLTSISYSDGTPIVTLQYDSAYGRRTQMVDGSGTTNYVYNDLDAVTSVSTTYTGLSAKTLQYTYHPDGSRKHLSAPGLGLDYTYNLAGQLTGMTDLGSTPRFTWAYTNNGLIGGAANPINHTTYTYNRRGYLTGQQTMGNTNQIVQFQGSFTYDGIGNRLTESRSHNIAIPPPPLMPTFINPNSPNGATTFLYHPDNLAHPYGPLYKETSTRFGGFTNINDYDAALNPTTLRGSAATFNTDNQDATFIYDGNGNPTTYRNHAGAPVALTFDAENRMTAFGTALTFGHNGDGLRAWKQAGTTRTWFLYDGAQPIIEMNGSGTVVATSLYGPTGLFARRANTTWVYHTFDPSGNLVTTNTNPLSGSIEGFDAYGNPSNPGIGTPFQYQGAWGSYTDSETGLVLQGHRYYDPATGRWLTRDPIGYAGGINLYGYVGGDPVNWADPSGEVPVLLITGAVGAVIGGIGGGVSAYVSGGDVLSGMGKGALVGGISGLTGGFIGGLVSGAVGGGVVGGILGGAAGGAAGDAAGQGTQQACGWRRNYDPYQTAAATAVGGVGGGLLWRPTNAGVNEISHWGPPSPWVMTGGVNRLNWILTGKFRNPAYPYSSGYSTPVQGDLSYPAGLDSVKGLFGQRIYTPK